jgi:hypothetical protein
MKSTRRRPGRPPKSQHEKVDRIALGIQVSGGLRAYLEEIATRYDTSLSRAIEIELERARAISIWLEAMQTDPAARIGTEKLVQWLRNSGWISPHPNVWIQPADLRAGPPELGSPTLEEVIADTKKEPKS